MTLILSILAAVLAASPVADAGDVCALRIGTPSAQRTFTNEDLARMAACRQASFGSQDTPAPPASASPTERRAPRSSGASRTRNTGDATSQEQLEADWRARWRSMDQRVRKLRFEARELRLEAEAMPRDPRKRPTGRRTPALLVAKAERLEAEAREIEGEFAESARRQGALPGWLRPPGR